jgi:hypothetical protein
MAALASLICGFVFGWGLLISGMTQTSKVLGFLDVLGAWDPTLIVVMASGLIVSAVGFALMRRLQQPYLAPQPYWSSNSHIDSPLIVGAAIFGIGWGMVGLCPGPALLNLATLSAPVIVFVAAMAAGMLLHDLWWSTQTAPWRARGAIADG